MNNQQLEYWNGEVGQKWRDNHAALETMFCGLTKQFIAEVGDVQGKKILDIGCGAGDVAKTLAFEAESVTGIDLSAPLLHLANENAPKNAVFIEADILDYEAEHKFDIAVSRFGMMFFENPSEGFRHIRKLLGPNAKLVFMVWQSPEDNEWVKVPKDALKGIAEAISANNPNAPGPFALADIARLENILRESGFSNWSIKSIKEKMTLAENEGIEGACGLLAKVGPASRSITQLTERDREIAFNRLSKALEPFLDCQSVKLEGAVHIVTALI